MIARFQPKSKSEAFCLNLDAYKELGNISPLFSLRRLSQLGLCIAVTKTVPFRLDYIRLFRFEPAIELDKL